MTAQSLVFICTKHPVRIFSASYLAVSAVTVYLFTLWACWVPVRSRVDDPNKSIWSDYLMLCGNDQCAVIHIKVLRPMWEQKQLSTVVWELDSFPSLRKKRAKNYPEGFSVWQKRLLLFPIGFRKFVYQLAPLHWSHWLKSALDRRMIYPVLSGAVWKCLPNSSLQLQLHRWFRGTKHLGGLV